MFLVSLNDDEKKLFLNLANVLMTADKKITKEEENVYARYKIECGFPEFVPELTKTYDQLIDGHGVMSTLSKKVIVVELWGVALADEISDEEVKFIEEVGKKLQIASDDIKNLRVWMEDMIACCKFGWKLVNL